MNVLIGARSPLVGYGDTSLHMGGIGTSARRAPIGAALVAVLAQLACSSPTSPSSSTITRLDVSAAAAGALSVAPGQTLQLKAAATFADGSQRDVTGMAVWQSSDPKTAAVSMSGMVTGGLAGAVDVSATLEGVTGKAHIDVATPPSNCAAATLSSSSSSFTPFADVVQAQVLTPFSNCRWTARSDAAWLTHGSPGSTFQDPGRSGDGWVVFNAAVNNTLAARTGRIVMTFTDGVTLVHTVTQSPPACVFALSPDTATWPLSGGEGSFAVQATPSSCAWTAWIDPRIDPRWNLHVSGIFAFVLYDKRSDNYLIARDPIGVVPLYTGRDEHGNLYVASEMKGLIEFCRVIEDFPPGHYLTRGKTR